jgi:hypothetical protein
MAASAPAIVVDASDLTADVPTIDALARLQLNALRIGRLVRLRNTSAELRHLIAFLGLDEVLRVEPGGQAEQREDALGVEEERQFPDPPA